MAVVNPERQVLNQDLFKLVCGAVAEGLRYVERRQARGDIAEHHDWPKLEWHGNGMPWFTTEFSEVPLDYKNALSPGFLGFMPLDIDRPPEPVFEEEAAFVNLAAYIRANERLAAHFLAELEIFTVHLTTTIGALVDRFVHTQKTTAFEVERFLPVYLPVEKFWLTDHLPVTILVPILFLKFETKQHDLGDGVFLQELEPEVQLARAPRERHGHHPLVQGCSTHGFALTNYSIPNENWLRVGHLEGNPRAYPVSTIDTLFGALRIVTGHGTGYAQLLFAPVDWASYYTANISRLDGAVVRSYPPWFEDGGWDGEVPTVSQAEIQNVGELFEQLHGLTKDGRNPRLGLAVKRLNSALLRTTDEDGILDTVIGLEALLSSDGNQEMTYKVSLRMAALAKLDGNPNAGTVFRETKCVYGYRSAVAHGDIHGASKKRTILRGDQRIATIEVAVDLLRMALRTLSVHPEYLEAGRIDRELLIRSA
jgi:hypothetical protein